MRILKTMLNDVKVIQNQKIKDDRGFFMETYSYQKFNKIGIDDIFIQDNCSFSATRGILRGIHYQRGKSAQSKLVTCQQGEILDICVDLRKGSPTYKSWIAVKLTGEDDLSIYIPMGFGHAFLCLSDNVLFTYKVNKYYSKQDDRGVFYNDPEIGIPWESFGIEPTQFILSEKDKMNPLLINSDCDFVYEQ